MDKEDFRNMYHSRVLSYVKDLIADGTIDASQRTPTQRARSLFNHGVPIDIINELTGISLNPKSNPAKREFFNGYFRKTGEKDDLLFGLYGHYPQSLGFTSVDSIRVEEKKLPSPVKEESVDRESLFFDGKDVIRPHDSDSQLVSAAPMDSLQLPSFFHYAQPQYVHARRLPRR